MEEGGKPDERVRATLVVNEADIVSDEVKYIVANEDSFFYHLQTRQEVRNAFASRGAYDLADLPQFSLRSLSPQELLSLGVPRDIVMKIGAGSGVPGFAATLYQDFITGPAEYVLSFAGTDDIVDWIDNIWQASGWLAPQYTAAMSVAHALSTMSPGIPDGNLVTTGHSLGGGLASAAAVVADSIISDTFNAAGLNFLTLMMPDGSGGYVEIYSGSALRYFNATAFVDAFYVDWDLLSLVQDNTDLPTALGDRELMDGPYDFEVLLGIPTVISDEYNSATPWSAVASILGGRLYTLVQAHLMPAVLYGLLVDLSGVDVFGYEL